MKVKKRLKRFFFSLGGVGGGEGGGKRIGKLFRIYKSIDFTIFLTDISIFKFFKNEKKLI